MDNFDIEKNIDMNSISKNWGELEALKEQSLVLKNRRSTVQLSDTKKKSNGFLSIESVIDVGQHEYGISDGGDILYTAGIEPCCGVVIYDKKHSMLLHLDGSEDYSEVIELADAMGFSESSHVIVAPGVSCGMVKGSFDYVSLESAFRERGFSVEEHRIPNTLGFITVDSNNITIGTLVNRSLDVMISRSDNNYLINK